MKKKNKILIALIFILIIAVISIGIIIIIQNISMKKAIDKGEYSSYKFHKEYKEVNKVNNFEYITIEQVLDIKAKGSGIIFFSFPMCPWCQVYAPVLDQVSREQDIKIYYYNPLSIRTRNTKEYKELIKIFGDYLETDKNENKKLYVPHVFVIKNGKVIGENNSMSTMSGDAKKYFTEEKKEELKKNLTNILKNFNNVCSDIEGRGGC